MKDSTRRTIRGAIDLILGILAACAAIFLVPGINDVFDELGQGGRVTLFSTIVLALTVFFTKLKNALEDNTRFPALLKAPANEGENPIPDPEQYEATPDEILDAENNRTPVESPYLEDDFDGVQDDGVDRP